MTETLRAALEKLAGMKHPSVEKILRGNRYGCEADAVAAVVSAYEAAKQKTG